MRDRKETNDDQAIGRADSDHPEVAAEMAGEHHDEILNGLRVGVLANDDAALMRLAAHLQACPECGTKLSPLVDLLSAATSDEEPGTIARSESLQAGPGMREHEEGMVERGTTVYGSGREAAQRARQLPTDRTDAITCVQARSELLDYLQAGGDLSTESLNHLRTCAQCGAHFTDAVLTRHTRESYGEEELHGID